MAVISFIKTSGDGTDALYDLYVNNILAERSISLNEIIEKVSHVEDEEQKERKS